MAPADAAPLVIRPSYAVAGARVDIGGARIPFDGSRVPSVLVGEAPARVVFASAARLGVIVPEGAAGGRQVVRIEGVGTEGTLHVGRVFASGVHQVDSPVYGPGGDLFVTYSGTRGEHVPVSIFRVGPDGSRAPFVSDIVNPTSLAVGPGGDLYVSSRFEGTVYRVAGDGSHTVVATDLGVACGLAFDRHGDLLVGDRSGTVLRVDRNGRTSRVVTLPPSIAAFHLAVGPDGWLYVAAPTLDSSDPLYRVDPDGRVEQYLTGFGRPQGLAFDLDGRLHVCDAQVGGGAVYRVAAGPRAEVVVAGCGLVGLAFDSRGGFVVSSNDTVYRFDEYERAGDAVKARGRSRRPV